MAARTLLSTLAALLVVCSVAAPAKGAETVWSGLVLASNAPQPTPIPAELSKLEDTLKHLFGYNQFEVIGQSRNALKTGEENWLAKSKYFSLHVDSKTAVKSGYDLNLK